MFRGPSNGGVDSLGKRDRQDQEDEEGNKKEKLSFHIPPPIFPPRKDIPPLPTIDIHNYTMLTTLVKIKQNLPFSIYNLNQQTAKIVDGVERYSNRFSKVKEKSRNSSIEFKLPGIRDGYFPFDLVANKKKPKKKLNLTGKTLEELQKLEKEGVEGEGEENEEEEEEEEEEEDGDYGEDIGVDDDEDMDDGDEERGGDEDFF